MTAPLRNRIKGHRRVRFGDLVPHEANPRVHSALQRQVLESLYEEIGFARSVLAYELPDGRLKLIDGHLRAALTPDEVLEVEVLDLSDDEAKVLLMTLDPLAARAGYDAELLQSLRQVTEQDSEAVRALWQDIEAEKEFVSAPAAEETPLLEEQFLILIVCEDETQQVQLLRRFQDEGLSCKARVA